MASKADRKKKKTKAKTSTARRRAEKHVGGGGEFSTMKIPEGMQLFKPKAGTYKMDIIPFVAGEGNPFADPGEEHYERTFFTHPRIGPSETAFCCPAKTASKKCAVCKEQSIMSQDPDCDDKTRKSLLPKQRQLFLVYVHKEAEKGVQLWEYSYHNFGKLLDSRVRNSDEDDGYDFFYFGDTDGMTLKVTFEEESSPYGKFIDTKSIDFIVRKEDVDDEILEQAVCLDELLKIPSYEELANALAGNDDDDEDDEDDEDDAPKKKKRTKKEKEPAKAKTKKGKKKPEPEPDPDDDEDDEDDEDDDEAEDEEWLLEQAELAEDDDDEAQEALTDRAEAVDLNPKKFKSWKKLVKAILAEEENDEDDDDDDEDNDDEDDDDEDEDESDEEDEDDEDDDDWDDEDDEDEEPVKPKKGKSKAGKAQKGKVKSRWAGYKDEDIPF